MPPLLLLAHPGWCTLFAPLCHQPAPKPGTFNVGYGSKLVFTPFTDSYAYHSEYNGSRSASALGLEEGWHAGAAADKFADILAPRGDPSAGDGELTWVGGASLAEAGKDNQGVAKRGEALRAAARAAAVAGIKYIITEAVKAGGRQIYKSLHSGDTSGLNGTIFEKAPHQPYSWELQAIEDQKKQAKAWEVIQRKEEAAREQEAASVGRANARRAVEEGEAEEVEDDGGKEEEEEEKDIVRIENVYFGDAWDEV